MVDPQFLVIRYPPGAAGRFLAVMLMGNDNVAHYDASVKTIEDKLAYAKNSFPNELGNWLLSEPNDKIAWNITFVSNKYPRGDNLTKEEFNKLATEKCTEWYHKNVSLGKKIIIPWHKTNIPIFYKGQSITIVIDKKSERWYNRARWYKHFGIKDGKIYLRENDPAIHRDELKKIVASYNNPILLDESFFSFVKKTMVSKEVAVFKNYSLLPAIDDDCLVNLSNLLSEQSCIDTINQLCDKLNLPMINQDYLKNCFAHWRNLHPF